MWLTLKFNHERYSVYSMTGVIPWVTMDETLNQYNVHEWVISLLDGLHHIHHLTDGSIWILISRSQRDVTPVNHRRQEWPLIMFHFSTGSSIIHNSILENVTIISFHWFLQEHNLSCMSERSSSRQLNPAVCLWKKTNGSESLAYSVMGENQDDLFPTNLSRSYDIFMRGHIERKTKWRLWEQSRNITRKNVIILQEIFRNFTKIKSNCYEIKVNIFF